MEVSEARNITKRSIDNAPNEYVDYWESTIYHACNDGKFKLELPIVNQFFKRIPESLRRSTLDILINSFTENGFSVSVVDNNASNETFENQNLLISWENVETEEVIELQDVVEG